jgi:hypothetical protein
MTISSELQARIDALPEENLKARIIRALTGPGKRTASNEEIFEHLMQNHADFMAQRALREERLYKRRNDEVLSFIEYFQAQQPQWYADYIHQERNGRDIDADLALNMRRLAEQWLPGLDWEDYGELFGKVRDYADAYLI